MLVWKKKSYTLKTWTQEKAGKSFNSTFSSYRIVYPLVFSSFVRFLLKLPILLNRKMPLWACHVTITTTMSVVFNVKEIVWRYCTCMYNAYECGLTWNAYNHVILLVLQLVGFVSSFFLLRKPNMRIEDRRILSITSSDV